MALSGTKKGTVTQNSSHFEYWMEWSATQDKVKNESTITVKHYWKKIGSKIFDSTTTRRYGIVIDGEPFEGEKRMDYSPWADKNISTATHTVKHNEDGTKSLTISTYANGRAGDYGPSSSSGTSGDCTASTTITLDPIPRAAQLLNATNFTDEAGSTVTYDNPAGTLADVQVGIFNTAGTKSYAAYRSVSKTGTSYTFSLTEAEKQKLIADIPDGQNTMYVNIYMKTYIDGVIAEDPRCLTRIFTVVNSTPEISYTVKDTGSVSTTLTNDSSVMIKGYNVVSAVMTPTYKKYATAKSQTITNGSQVVSGTSASFSYTENNKFTFYVKDRFGNEVSKTATMTLVDYVKLTCNISRDTPTADGKLAFTISGNYFNNTFGSKGVQNELTLKWCIKENDGAYGSWNTITPTKSGNTYNAVVNLTGLNYQSTYSIKAIATDSINTSGVTAERVTKSTPVFNWGEDNFDINVPLTVGENTTVNGVLSATSLSNAIFSLIYPVGSIYLSMSDTNPKNLFGGTWKQLGGRFLIGAGTADANTDNTFGDLNDAGYVFVAGSKGGQFRHTLTVNELPSHSHGATSTYGGAAFFIRHGGSAGTDTVAAGTGCTITEGASDVTWSNGFQTTAYSHKLDKVELKGTVSTTVNAAGGGTAHNNMPPYLIVYMWQRTA